jgi:hypothetical protein
MAQSYAPTPPPILLAQPKKSSAPEIAQAATQYSIGDPTDEEQQHLELINRARADATAEAQRIIALSAIDKDIGNQFKYWQVDTNLMVSEFSTNPPAPPLSMNAKLIQSARGHSQYQFDNAVQSHIGANGSTLQNRVDAVGYLWAGLGENVFTDATSVQQGHAAFEVDWGPNTNSLGQQIGIGGMQNPPGHRNSIHSPIFNEIGVGIVDGYNTANGNTVGPQVITEDFGRSATATTFITGVAYYDINGNGFYDVGEGFPNVQVTVDGVATFAVTSTSGGYSIPVPPNQTYTVRFGGPGITEIAKSVTAGSGNVKVDFKPRYVAPGVTSGPTNAYVGVDNTYHIAALQGATGYRARISQVGPIPLEGAEGSLSELTITTFGGYAYVTTHRHDGGTKSFQLAHRTDVNGADPQIIEFTQPIYVLTGGRLTFNSMLAVATPDEIASVQVSDDNGVTWNTLWSQAGADTAGQEFIFTTKSVSLAAYEGKTIHVRFIYASSGTYYELPAPSDVTYDTIGWFIDDIAFTNAQAVTSATQSAVFAQPTFAFNPATTGNYLLEFQSIVGARSYNYGPGQQVTAVPAPAIASLQKTVTVNANTVVLQFTNTTGATGTFSVVSSSSVAGPWQTETGAVITGPTQGVYTATVPRTAEIRFYRIATK